MNVGADDYTAGALEDWTEAALTFDGRERYAVITHEAMTALYRYRMPGQDEESEVSGREIASPDIHLSNLLVEAYFRAEPGHTGGVLVSKTDGTSGYMLAVNNAGSISFRVLGNGRTFDTACGVLVNDGEWHHVIAELDRPAGQARIYVDGRPTAVGEVELPEDISLSNEGDLLVGRGPGGHFFAGAMDFLRIARGTLADAMTTIDELYDWQFDGPFLRDFTGREPVGERRDAGALEYIPRNALPNGGLQEDELLRRARQIIENDEQSNRRMIELLERDIERREAEGAPETGHDSLGTIRQSLRQRRDSTPRERLKQRLAGEKGMLELLGTRAAGETDPREREKYDGAIQMFRERIRATEKAIELL